jgi:hypothetical protein
MYRHIPVLFTAVGSVNRLPVLLVTNFTSLEQNGHQMKDVLPTAAAQISL